MLYQQSYSSVDTGVSGELNLHHGIIKPSTVLIKSVLSEVGGNFELQMSWD